MARLGLLSVIFMRGRIVGIEQKIEHFSEQFEQFKQDWETFLQRLNGRIAAGDLTGEKQEELANALAEINRALERCVRALSRAAVNAPAPNSDASSDCT